MHSSTRAPQHPPEHYLAHRLGEALAASCRAGRLTGQGPDGKLLVRMRESTGRWEVEQILATLQQREDVQFLDLTRWITDDLRDAYEALRRRDARWVAGFGDLPLDVVYDMARRGERRAPEWFAHSAVRERYPGGAFVAELGMGRHFLGDTLPWNGHSPPSPP